MKKLILLLLLLATTLSTRADEFPYLAFQQTDGTITVLSVSGLNMRSTDGLLTVTNSETTFSVETIKLSKMYFTETATGILLLQNVSEAAPVEVWQAEGRYIGRFTSLAALSAKLTRGVYIIKKGTETIKLLVP
ncbi:MAG: hypothetical protein IJ786_05050 [Bacteroidaceae bacterium]|nr:hypothetical protein [Bacteroidaceae bacterium]